MKATLTMTSTNVKLLLEALTCEVDGLSAGLKALTEAVPRLKALSLTDGPRRVPIAPSGVSGALPFMGSVMVVDAVIEFAQDGDPLWAFDHHRGGLPVAGDVRQKALILERAVLTSYGKDCIRAYRAIVMLAGLHSMPVPSLGRQGRPEAG